MKNLFFLFIVTLFISCQYGKTQETPVLEEVPNFKAIVNTELINGPMVGYSTMKEVAIWIQGQPYSTYQLTYKSKNGDLQISEEVKVGGPLDNTAILLATNLLPGQTYSYSVIEMGWGKSIVGEGTFQSQQLWQWRTDPPAFDFALGSCVYVNEPELDRPGNPYGGNYRIFESIENMKPDFMIWGGDNTYLREADWNSKSGIWHRYTHTRQVDEMKKLMATTHNYATWDDHDFGPNNSDRSFFLKDATLNAFEKFWANPTYGINGKPGVTTKFQWNDCEFFVLDNRYYRTPNDRKTGERFILGQEQIDWLIDNLVNSNASFKFIVVGNQVINSAAKYENHATYADEREQLINLLREENIKNVIFLSGDRHHSEISALETDEFPTIYDITSSPLTSGSHEARDEGNIYQVEGSFIHERNYAFFNVTGKWGERKLAIDFYDVDGEKLFEYQINQEK